LGTAVPEIRAVLDPGFLVPDFLAELSAALWLAFKGVKLPVRGEEELRASAG